MQLMPNCLSTSSINWVLNSNPLSDITNLRYMLVGKMIVDKNTENSVCLFVRNGKSIWPSCQNDL